MSDPSASPSAAALDTSAEAVATVRQWLLSGAPGYTHKRAAVLIEALAAERDAAIECGTEAEIRIKTLEIQRERWVREEATGYRAARAKAFEEAAQDCYDMAATSEIPLGMPDTFREALVDQGDRLQTMAAEARKPQEGGAE